MTDNAGDANPMTGYAFWEFCQAVNSDGLIW